MTVINRIGEIVSQKGWNIKQFADRAGLAYNTAHDLCTGSAKRIGLDVLDRVCKVLEVQPGEVLVRVEEAPSDTIVTVMVVETC